MNDKARSFGPIGADARLSGVVAGGIALALCLLPVMRLFIEPLLAGTDVSGALGRPAAIRALFNTLETGLASAVLATLLGAGLGFAVAICDLRGRQAFAFLFAFSMMVAPQVIALAFKALAGPSSPLLGLAGLTLPPGAGNPMLGAFGITLVLALHHAPMVMLLVIAGLRSVPHEIVEAAAMDGARPARILREMLLPLLRGHVLAGGLLAFIAAIGNFGIPALLGLPANYLTLPTLIYRRMVSFGPGAIGEVAVLALLLAALLGAAMAGSAFLIVRRAQTLAAGPRLRPFWRLGRLRPVGEFALAALLLLAFGLPVVSLVLTALAPALGVPVTLDTMTLRAFSEVLFRQHSTLEAFGHSFIYAGLAACLVAILSLPLAYQLERRGGRMNAPLRLAIDIPYALPGVVLAIAMILVFLKPLPVLGVSLYGTAAIIILAYVARFLALGLKPVGAAMAQIDPSIEEAGMLDGAGFFRRLFDLLLPLVQPGLSAGILLVFLVAFNELTVSALLWSANTRTLGVILFSYDEAGLAAEASALGLSTMVVVLVAMLGLTRLSRALPEGAVPWVLAPGRDG